VDPVEVHICIQLRKGPTLIGIYALGRSSAS
jgi:hypothetical protein